MKKIWNALRYGDSETRKSIGSVIFFIVLGLSFIVVSGITGQFFLFVIGMISGAVALVISQSFELVDDDFVAEIDKNGNKDTVHSVSVKKDGLVVKNKELFDEEIADRKEEAINKALEAIENVGEEDFDLYDEKIAKKEERIRKKYSKNKVKKSKDKTHKEKDEKQDIEKTDKEKRKKASKEKIEKYTEEPEESEPKKKRGKRIKEKKEEQEEKEEKTPKIKKEKQEKEIEIDESDIEEADELFDEEEVIKAFEKYDNQVLKQVKKKYRVKRDHRPILIDNSQSYKIKECPAFIWRVHNKVYLLLLENEPRKISISREMIKHVGYVPHVRGDKNREYRAFEKENLITTVFRDYLPDYYTYKSEKKQYKAKNLYYIYPDIQITSRSIAQVMDLLCLNFMPSDRITRSDQFNGFFKRIYAAHILYDDKAYTITEYKNEVEKILGELSMAEMPQREFNNTLENLVRSRFISQEYADHYYRLRDKSRSKSPDKQV